MTAASRGGNNRLNEKPKDPWLRRKWNEVHGAGKGDAPRSVDKEKFDAEYERIFGKKSETFNTWDPNDPDHPRNQKENH